MIASNWKATARSTSKELLNYEAGLCLFQLAAQALVQPGSDHARLLPCFKHSVHGWASQLCSLGISAKAPMNNDELHLKLLKIFHYVLAGLSCLFSSFFLIHVFIGWSTMHGSGMLYDQAKNPPPPGFGLMFFIMGTLVVCFGWLFGAAIAYSGYSIGRRRHHLFCLIIAGLMCAMCNPIGTVLGVFTFVVLLRPSVRELFQPPVPKAE